MYAPPRKLSASDCLLFPISYCRLLVRPRSADKPFTLCDRIPLEITHYLPITAIHHLERHHYYQSIVYDFQRRRPSIVKRITVLARPGRRPNPQSFILRTTPPAPKAPLQAEGGVAKDAAYRDVVDGHGTLNFPLQRSDARARQRVRPYGSLGHPSKPCRVDTGPRARNRASLGHLRVATWRAVIAWTMLLALPQARYKEMCATRYYRVILLPGGDAHPLGQFPYDASSQWTAYRSYRTRIHYIHT